MRSLSLRAGPLTCVFDPVLGAVRYVRPRRARAVRSVYGAVRDRFWNTVAPRIDDRAVRHIDQERRSPIRPRRVRRRRRICLDERSIGGRDGTFRVVFDGEALSTFWRNRIGLCVLHPLEMCGPAVHRHHVDWSRARSVPCARSPHQAFLDISAIEYGAGPEAASGSRSRAISSRWRISATGGMPPSRPIRRALEAHASRGARRHAHPAGRQHLASGPAVAVSQRARHEQRNRAAPCAWVAISARFPRSA